MSGTRRKNTAGKGNPARTKRATRREPPPGKAEEKDPLRRVYIDSDVKAPAPSDSEGEGDIAGSNESSDSSPQIRISMEARSPSRMSLADYKANVAPLRAGAKTAPAPPDDIVMETAPSEPRSPSGRLLAVDLTNSDDEDDGEAMRDDTVEEGEEGEIKREIPSGAAAAASLAASSVSTDTAVRPASATTPATTNAPSVGTADSQYVIPRYPRAVQPPPQADLAPRADDRLPGPRPPEFDSPYSEHPFHGHWMTLDAATERKIFTRVEWRSWLRMRREQGGTMHDMVGTPCVYTDTLRDHTYDSSFWHWVSVCHPRVDIDFYRESLTFSTVTKVRDMRFRFATLVAHGRVDSEIAAREGRGDAFPVQPLPPTGRRDSSREDFSSISRGAGPVAAATGTSAGSRAPTGGPYLGSPPGAIRGPPTYSRHSDIRATSLEAGGVRGVAEHPRSPRRGSAGPRYDPTPAAGSVLADVRGDLRGLGERLDRLQDDTEHRLNQLLDHSETDFRRIDELRRDAEALAGRVEVLEKTQGTHRGWLNQLWGNPQSHLEPRVARLEADGDRRIAALEQQVSRLLDFQNSVTHAMLAAPTRRLPAPEYRRPRSRSRSRSPHRFDDTL